MKLRMLARFAPLFLAAGMLFGAASCEPDDVNPPEDNSTELRHDAGNVSGPILDAGLHRFAVRFSESELRSYAGRELTGIRIFIGRAPQSMELLVYEGGDQQPGTDIDLIRAASPIPSGGFYDYEFAQPLPINVDKPLWIVAEVELSSAQQSIGCDAGPAKRGGDWLWSEDSYVPYSERTPESVNWNIRGIVK